MADVTKLKKIVKNNSLGSPPSVEEASHNLEAPENLSQSISHIKPLTRRDGRTMRRTNRTLPFATRVSPEFDNQLRDLAERDGLKLVEVLEKALDAYEKQFNNAAR
jgi:hypothetical protein